MARSPATFTLVATVAIVVAVPLSGCLGTGGGGSAADAPSTPVGPDGGKAPDRSSRDPGRATLDEAPTWQVGEWWMVERHDFTTGETLNVTVVVADRHGDTYHVGLAADDFEDRLVLFGWPPLGEIRTGSDLSWTVKNSDFRAAGFPLEEGRSWETPYWGVDGWTAEVESVDGTEATIGISGPYGNATYEYDAATGTTTTFAWQGETDYRVTDHGSGYEGQVVVPHGKQQHEQMRAAGAFTFGESPLPDGLTPAGPRETVEVDPPDASVLLIAGSAPLPGAQTTPPGLYRETATAPDGTSFELQTTGEDGLEFAFAHASEASGTWQFDHVAGGFGVAGTEMIAYEQLNVTVGGNATAGQT